MTKETSTNEAVHSPRRFDTRDYLAADQYIDAIEKLRIVTILILFEFEKHQHDSKHCIIRNFLARSNLSLLSLKSLWSIDAREDCWVLFRCILDRLFHLVHIAENDQFEEFEEWSLTKQHSLLHSLVCDPEMKGKVSEDLLLYKKSIEEKHGQVLHRKSGWQRPKAKDVAKMMRLEFLYRYGYDFASTMIHPMANDGEEALFRQLGLKDHPRFQDHRSVLVNASLCHTLLVRAGMSYSGYEWLAVIHEFFDDMLKFLDDGAIDFMISFAGITSLGPGCELSKSPDEKQ